MMAFLCSRSATIDNLVFRIHSHYTSVIFLFLALLVLGHSYFTDIIDCVSGDSHIPWGVLDAVCYVQGTYSVPSAWKKAVGHEVPYPGIETYNPNENRIYHYYYKWIGWMLLFQSLLFFLPGYFWRCVERGRVSTLLKGLEKSQSSGVVAATDNVYNFLHINRKRENLALLIGFVSFELLNTISLIVQIIFVNQMLNNNFLTYGWLAVFSTGTSDIQTKVFPDQAKCSLLRFTSSGDIQRTDSTCVLSSNFLYAQIYLFIWLWFHFLLTIGVFDLLLRCAILINSKARQLSTELPVLRISSEDNDLSKLIAKLPVGSWFILHLISKNVDIEQFHKLVKTISTSLNKDGYFGETKEVRANGGTNGGA